MRNIASGLLVSMLFSLPAMSAGTDELSKAKAQVSFVYKRLTGTPALAKDIESWGAGLVAAPDKQAYLNDVVAKAAIENDKFYAVTVLNFAQMEANKERALVDAPTGILNDLTATVVGMVRDEKDYRAILSDDVVYVPTGATYAAGTNAIYDNLYNNVKNDAVPLAASLTEAKQSVVTGLPMQAGIFTLRGFGSVYYEAGTNRGPFRFTAVNYLCRDMEDLSDVTRADVYVRRDVDRAPGGDATKYRTECVGCHAGLDPLAKAFAFVDFVPAAAANAPSAITFSTTPVAKNNRNSEVFPAGADVRDDSWVNLLLEGTHANLGWDPGKREGKGIKSLGEMLAATKMFPECMAKRVYKTVCLKEGTTRADKASISKLAGEFSKTFNMKELFKETAVECASNAGG